MAQPTYSRMASQMLQSKPLERALLSLHYIYPATVFLYFVVSSAVAVCSLSEKKKHPRRRLLLSLMLIAVLSYLGQIAAILIPSIVLRKWLGQQDSIISLLSCILVFGIQLATLSDADEVTWYPYIGPYLLALVFEPALEIISLSARLPGSLDGPEIAQLCVVACRYLVVALVVTAYFASRDCTKPEPAADSEQQPLIPKNDNGTPVEASEEPGESRATTSYGSTTENSSADSSETETENENETDASKSSASDSNYESPWERREREAREEMEKRLKENGNWLDYAKRFLIFVPYIWPVNNRPLQVRAVLVGVCLLANNVLNFLIPRQLGIIMDSLSGINHTNPWAQVIIFAGLKFCASEAGLSLLRQWLWIPVEYYSFDAMSTAAYSHVLNLSSDFHDSKSSSDIMMAISSGQSISNLLESICFSAIPMLVDMGIAFVYLSATFGPYEGFITIATAVIFFYIAGRMIAGLKKARRSEVSAWFEEHYVRQAGIQGWSTVASFNQVSHEEERYSAAVKARVAKSQAVYLGYLMAYAFQYLVLLAGLLAGAFLAVWQVTSGQATPGQFIMLLTYWTQLVSPLTFFASLGKNISRNFIQAEQLLEIMKTEPTIVNKENAVDLQFSGGAVEFEHVSFSYNDKKDILKDISFTAQPGTTVAFVGATGAGKSTILKLLDRFYDVSQGSIKIDNQDIRDVNLFSLRSRIGIVPQAPILFDDTVMNNVRYANLAATDEEVYEACKAAAIHDQILSFSDGYSTRVGERGIKLSGGELQRVAIARAILKSPSIVLLDEATSSVDTETEQKIQEALHALCRDRTTFVVAHRLSTVMNADCIIVVAGGSIVEMGCHGDLIQAGGKYANLWSKQVFTKPKDKANSSEASTLNMDDMFNDLTPEVATNELKRTKQKSPVTPGDNNGSTGTDEDVSESGHDSTKDENKDQQVGAVAVTKPPSVDKTEETRLNPVAPAFTPRAFVTSVLRAVSPCEVSRQVAVESKTTESGREALSSSSGSGFPAANQGRIAEHENETNIGIGAIVRPFGNSSDTFCHSGSERQSFDVQQSGTDATEADDSPKPTESQDSAIMDPATASCNAKGSMRGRGKPNRAKWSRPKYSRRVQSKSEPSVHASNES